MTLLHRPRFFLRKFSAGAQAMATALALGLALLQAPVAAAADAGHATPYRIFDRTGAQATYEQLVHSASRADVVFFGEQHNDAMAHWLQLQLFKSLHAQNPTMALAMEMMEADDQTVLDEYLGSVIEESHLQREAKLWPNYKTDYRPLVEFAKTQKLPVVASNVPRRYAALVHRQGLEALEKLSPAARQWIAPLPIAVDLSLPGYQRITTGMGKNAGPGTPENMARAQGVKDATMAHFIAQVQGRKVYHVNGAYHSQSGEGILSYLRPLRPEWRIATVQTVAQDDVRALDAAHHGLADFLIAVPKDMAKSY